MPRLLASHEIGGAYVRRRFEFGPRTVAPPETLTAEQVRTIPVQNLRALVNQGKLELYPLSPKLEGTRRFAIHMGMGKFDVIEGHKLNTQPLTRAEAEAMLPPQERPKGRRKKKSDA